MRSLSFSPDGSTLMVLAGDRLHLWDVAQTRRLGVKSARGRRGAQSALFVSKGERIAVVDEQVVRLLDTRSGEELGTPLELASAGRWLAFDERGSRLLVGTEQGNALLFDISTGAELAELGRNGLELSAGAFTPDGRRIVTASRDGSLRIWGPGRKAELLKITEVSNVRGTLRALWVTPDGRRIVALSEKGELRIIDTRHEEKELSSGELASRR